MDTDEFLARCRVDPDMSTLDFGPATTTAAQVVAGIRDDQLGDPSPCPDYTVADLLDHMNGLSFAFTAAALKQPLADPDPSGDSSRLPDDWREAIPAALAGLAAAWRDTPGAFEGTTQAGPIEMPAPEAALVALNEVVVHGWDLAAATGQPYPADDASVVAARQFVESFEAPADESPDDPGLFGPPVAVPDDAPELDRLLGATGRRPDWTP